MERSDLVKLAVDDVRIGLKIQHDVILFVDRQASDLLRLYVTLIIAAGSFALTKVGALEQWPLVVGLIAVVVLLSIGAAFCFRAIDSANVANPALRPQTWQIILDDPEADGLQKFLDNANAVHLWNVDVNKKGAQAYRRARWCGVAAVFFGAAAFGAAYLVLIGFTSPF